MLTILVSLASNLSNPVRAQSPPGLAVLDPLTGHSYQIVQDTTLTWTGSVGAAEQRAFNGAQGHLATIGSLREQQFLEAKFGTTWLADLHLGGRQLIDQTSPSVGWQWITGEPWDFVWWAAGKPDDGTASGIESGGANHLAFAPGGRWRDRNDGPGSGYLVEYEYSSFPSRGGYRFVNKIGPNIAVDFRFGKTRGIAEGPDGTIYLAENQVDAVGHGRVSAFDASGNFKGIIVSGVPFIEDILFHPDGHLYIAQSAGGWVGKYRLDGTFEAVLASFPATGLALKPNGNIVAVDHPRALVELTPDGTEVARTPTNRNIWDVACDKDGNAYATYVDHTYILRFDGNLQYTGEVNVGVNCHALTFDPQGRLHATVVSYQDKYGFIRFSNDWAIESSVINPASATGDDQFNYPLYCAFLSDGRVGFADYFNERFVFWRDLATADTTAPTSAASISPSTPASGWFSSTPVSVNLTATDDASGSGVKEIRYSVDMGAEVATAGASATATISGEGIHSVAYWSVDNAGNIESTQYATVRIDLTAPVTTASVSGGFVTLSASDGFSGVAKTYYRINGGAATEYTGPFPANVSRIAYWSVDQAGNTESESTQVLNPAVSSVSLSAVRVVGGIGILGQVSLDADAPAGGTVVSLASSDPAAATSASVTVAAGTRTASFTVSTTPVSTDRTALLSATAYGTTSATGLQILAPQPVQVTFSPSSVTGGTASTGTLQLTGIAPTGGWVVSLSSNSASVSVPSTVTVPAGQFSATFTASTTAVATSTTSAVTATSNGGFSQGSLTVTPAPPSPGLTSLTLTPSTVKGEGRSTGKVVLSSAAPAGGTVVSLSSSKTSAATVPASVTVAAGATSATFTVSTKSQKVSTTVTISAKLGTVTKTAVLTVTK